MMKYRWRVAVAGWLAANLALAGDLSDKEQQIAASVEGRYATDLELIEELVNVNSGTMNFAGVRQTGEMLAPHFEAIGFDVEWVDGESFHRAGHLVASRDGMPGSKKLLLIGHIDTVFEPDSPFQNFEMVDEHHARGPGITDMLGGDVVMLSALTALHQNNVLDQLSVRVVITGDEEKRGLPLEVAIAALIDAADWADVAIGFEDGDGDPATAVISRRGSSSWKLSVTGRPAHSSQVFREDIGFGAIYELARIIDGFRTTLAETPNLTFNPGVVVGGTQGALDSESAEVRGFGKNNVIAEFAEASGDLRAVSIAQREDAKQRMQAIVASSLPGTSAELVFRDSYPPLAPSEGNRRLLAIYDQVSRDAGFGPVAAVDPRRAGAADVSFAEGRVEMAIDGLGLMGDGGHTVNEVADLTTLTSQTVRAALLMYRLSAQE